jgi:hypothetical protein
MRLIGRGNKPMPSSVPSQMPKDVAISRVRRLAGPAALIGTAGGLAAIAVHDRHWGIEWGLLAFAGLVGLAGVGLSRRSMSMQMLSRATAWVVLAPTALVTAVSTMGSHSTEWTAALLAAGSGAALLLARPMLHTKEARADFAPTSWRKWLLAGATASAAIGIVTGALGLDSFHWHPASAVGLVALAVSLIASAIGVVRMRAWGILLGAATSFAVLLAASIKHDAAGLALSLTAIPGFMLLLPVLIAKRQRAKAEAASSFTRVASHVSYDDVSGDQPSRVRIATDSRDMLEDDTDSADDLRAAAPPPAARAQA